MADTAGTFLADQIVINAIFLIQIGVDIHLTDVVEQVKIEIGNLTFFQLFFKNFFYFVHVRQVISREFIRKIKAFAGMFCQRLSHDQFGISIVISPGGVIIIDAVFHRIIHHLTGSSFIDPGIIPVDDRKAHRSHSKSRKFQILILFVNHTHSSLSINRHVPSCFQIRIQKYFTLFLE